MIYLNSVSAKFHGEFDFDRKPVDYKNLISNKFVICSVSQISVNCKLVRYKLHNNKVKLNKYFYSSFMFFSNLLKKFMSKPGVKLEHFFEFL